ncbi:putative polyadenylate binding protein [Histomonas meleagridis]|uniref:putative polyadenylate binding protein n=1 Tax=Histomonas meleagridis TaxID=135588 RepID=UPI003559383A|nr:putative polyadenylate binding protein [Histomonas meleagridis]KAH0802809.1 putative polyadenylate binding protein [Histomonas meleagridis]
MSSCQHSNEPSTITIRNIPVDELGYSLVTESMLVNLFKSVGTIVEDGIRIYNSSPSYAFVTFSNYEMADLAVHNFNYSTIAGHTLYISHYSAETRDSISSSDNNIFIEGIDNSFTERKLHLFISRLLNCEVISCKISMRIGPDNKPINSGYGYVRFLHSEDAKNAILKLNGCKINGNEIKAKLHDTEFTNLYIKNLPKSIKTDEDLRKLFSKFGTVASPKIKKNGFGFCNMADHESAVAAINGLHGKRVDGHVLYVQKYVSQKGRMVQRDNALRRKKF